MELYELAIVSQALLLSENSKVDPTLASFKIERKN